MYVATGADPGFPLGRGADAGVIWQKMCAKTKELTVGSRVSRSDLGMIWKSGNHSQISKYFRVLYIKTGEGEG